MKHSKLLSRVVATASACAVATLGLVTLSAAPSGAATKAPISIGYICSCTSALASSVVTNRTAYEAYVDWTNAHGGIDGHQIKLYLADDSGNPATSSADVHTFVQTDHVAAIVSLAGSPSSWDTYVEGLHIPVVGADGSPEDFYTSPDFFFPGQTDDSLPAAVALAAKKVGSKNFGVFYCAEAPSCQQLVAPLKAVGAQYGVSLSYIAEISASAPNYTAQCLAAQQAGIKALFIGDAVSVV